MGEPPIAPTDFVVGDAIARAPLPSDLIPVAVVVDPPSCSFSLTANDVFKPAFAHPPTELPAGTCATATADPDGVATVPWMRSTVSAEATYARVDSAP